MCRIVWHLFIVHVGVPNRVTFIYSTMLYTSQVHLSFSLQGGGGDGKGMQIQSNIINVFLQSVGVVLTDIQDVVFK